MCGTSSCVGPWLVGSDCEGLWLLIELRICIDPEVISPICLIIVKEGEESGERGVGNEGGGSNEEWPSDSTEKAGFLNQLFTFGGCRQR